MKETFLSLIETTDNDQNNHQTISNQKQIHFQLNFTPIFKQEFLSAAISIINLYCSTNSISISHALSTDCDWQLPWPIWHTLSARVSLAPFAYFVTVLAFCCSCCLLYVRYLLLLLLPAYIHISISISISISIKLPAAIHVCSRSCPDSVVDGGRLA